MGPNIIVDTMKGKLNKLDWIFESIFLQPVLLHFPLCMTVVMQKFIDIGGGSLVTNIVRRMLKMGTPPFGTH